MVLGRLWKRREAFGTELSCPTRRIVIIAVVALWNVSIVILGGRIRISNRDWSHTFAVMVTATAAAAACVGLATTGVVWSSWTLFGRRR